MKLRELTEIQRPQYNPEQRYTIYRGMKHIPYHDSGVPMGDDIPKKAFVKGVPGNMVQNFLNKLNDIDSKEEFTVELDEVLSPEQLAAMQKGAQGLAGVGGNVLKGIKAKAPGVIDSIKGQLTPKAIAGAAALSLAGNAVAKGVERVGKEVVDDEDDESVEEQKLKELISPMDIIKGTNFGTNLLGKKSIDFAKNKAIDYAKKGVAKATAATTLPVIGAAGAGALGGLLAVDAAKKLNPFKKKKQDKEEVTEGEERSIIKQACIDKLVDNFAGRENQFQNKDDLEYAIYQQLEDLDVADCVDPDMEVGGQRIGDFASGRVIDCCNSGDIIYDVMANMDEYQIGEDIDKMSMGDTIKDFYKSDAPQIKGKSKKKRRQMAIAAKLATNEGSLNDYNFLSEREELDEGVLTLIKTFGKGVGSWIAKHPNIAGWLGVGGISVYGLLPAATNWASNNLGLIGLFAVGGVGLNEYLRRTGMSKQEADRAQKEWELNHKKKVAKELEPLIGKDAAFPEIAKAKDKKLAQNDRQIRQTDKKVQQFKTVTQS